MRSIAALVLLAGCGSTPRADLGAREAPPQAPVDTAFLEQYSKTLGFTLGRPAAIQPTPEGDAVLFLRSGPESFERDLFTFDVATKTEKVLLTAQQILQGGQERLSAQERARRERMRMTARGIASYVLSKDGTKILVPLSGRLFVVERASGTVTELPSEGAIDPRFSPDGGEVAFVREGDLWVTDVASRTERRLTTSAGGTIANGLAEFVAQEEMGRMQGYWWSPDARTIAFEQSDAAGVEVLHVANPAAPEEAPSASPYPRAGRQNVTVRLGLVPSAGGDPTWVEWDRERFPYLAKVTWEDAAPLCILVQNRRQTEEALLSVDPASGRTTEILVERDDAWLNLDGDVPWWLPDGQSFLWTTERGGAWQLELRAREGRLLRTLTPPEFGYRGLVDVDETRRTAIVRASAEPLESHLFRVSLDGTPPDRITRRAGEHDAVVSEKHGLWVHRLATKNGIEKQIVQRPDGAMLGELRSVARRPPFQPRIEWASAGEQEFRAIVIRPRDFVAGRRYPVIAAVYGGPTGRVVGSVTRRYLLDQWLADQGFVVVSLDGRGTPDRGRAWERAARERLGDLPLEDQVAGLQALAASRPEMDLSRVGIFGWSFGGYLSAMAVLRRPDVFHAGVAGAPVTDWRDYDTHYTERYMGLPDTEAAAYDRASLLTYAADLRRPLLVIHGTVDDNVLFLHSIRLSDALFRAGRPFEFLPLSGFTHMVPDPVVTSRLHARIADFFRRNLGAPER